MLSAQGVARRAAAPVVRAGTSRMMVRVSASKQKVSSGGTVMAGGGHMLAEDVQEGWTCVCGYGPESQIYKSVSLGLLSYIRHQQTVIGQPGRTSSCSMVVCHSDEDT